MTYVCISKDANNDVVYSFSGDKSALEQLASIPSIDGTRMGKVIAIKDLSDDEFNKLQDYLGPLLNQVLPSE